MKEDGRYLIFYSFPDDSTKASANDSAEQDGVMHRRTGSEPDTPAVETGADRVAGETATARGAEGSATDHRAAKAATARGAEESGRSETPGDTAHASLSEGSVDHV